MRPSVEAVIPTRGAVFENQGIPAGEIISRGIEGLYEKALALFVQVAEPVGILAEISKAEFAVVYQGEDQNEPRTPVGEAFPRAVQLALFAATLGTRIGQEIGGRFGADDFAVGSMLDAVASAAADKLAEVIEGSYRGALEPIDRETAPVVLRYSPGYCGWHISGQRKLFASLRPDRIGINLRPSYLMEPLKSVSGVIIAGSRDIHDFEDRYPFCNQCVDHGCRERLRVLSAVGCDEENVRPEPRPSGSGLSEPRP